MKDDAEFMFSFKKIIVTLILMCVGCPLYSMQNFSDLDKINSSLEKPKLSFDSLEKGIANLERIALQLNQELADLKKQLNDLKTESKLVKNDFRQVVAVKSESQITPVVAEPQSTTVDKNVFQQPANNIKMQIHEYPLDNG